MADNNNTDDLHRLEDQEKATKAEQFALENIQRLLGKIISRQNEGENSNHRNDEQPPPSGSSSVNADVIKGIQAQLASLTQRDELKKVGIVRPYALECDSVPFHQSSSCLRYIRTTAKLCQIGTFIIFGPRLVM